MRSDGTFAALAGAALASAAGNVRAQKVSRVPPAPLQPNLPDIEDPTTDWRENFGKVQALYVDQVSPALSRQERRQLMRKIARAEATEARAAARKPRRLRR